MVEPEGTPCYKVFIGHLLEATPVLQAEGGLALQHGGLRFERVWVQGTVRAREGRCFSLDDGTGDISVRLPAAAQLGVDDAGAAPGAYCLVAGKVVGGALLAIRAQKVVVFGSDKAMQQQMQWSAEVADLQRHVRPLLASPTA